MKFVKVTFVTDSDETFEAKPEEFGLRLVYPGQVTLTIPAKGEGNEGMCRPMVNFAVGLKL